MVVERGVRERTVGADGTSGAAAWLHPEPRDGSRWVLRARPRSGRSPWSRRWLVARRAVAFAYYGAGGLTIAFVVAPLHRLLGALTGRDEADAVGVQRIIHLASRSFVRLMELLRLMRVHWEGADALRHGPVLVVPNHPSLIDTPLLASYMPQADFVASPEWSENPFLKRACARAGYLRADRGADLVRDAAARLRAGRSVVIFPEGSRTPVDGLRSFRRGAAHIALEAGCDLLPVVIRVSPRTLMKGQRWSDAPEDMPEWRIVVGEPVRLADHLDGTESRPVAARRLTRVLEGYFEERWERGIS